MDDWVSERGVKGRWMAVGEWVNEGGKEVYQGVDQVASSRKSLLCQTRPQKRDRENKQTNSIYSILTPQNHK